MLSTNTSYLRLKPAKINNESIFIVNRRSHLLTAVVPSYLNSPGNYSLVFVFPHVETSIYDVEVADEHYIMVTQAREFRTSQGTVFLKFEGVLFEGL